MGMRSLALFLLVFAIAAFLLPSVYALERWKSAKNDPNYGGATRYTGLDYEGTLKAALNAIDGRFTDGYGDVRMMKLDGLWHGEISKLVKKESGEGKEREVDLGGSITTTTTLPICNNNGICNSWETQDLMPVVYAHSGDTVEVPYAVIIPKIDGKVTPVKDLEFSSKGKDLEWKDQVNWEYGDAVKIQLYDYQTKKLTNSYVFLKADEKYLYFLFDNGRDKNISFLDGYTLGFDVDHNGVYSGNDIMFLGGCHPDFRLATATPSSGIHLVNPSPSYDAKTSLSTSPNFPYKHQIYEGQIAKSIIGYSHTVGFYCVVGDGSTFGESPIITSLFPKNVDSRQLNTWSDLTYSATSIPEFSDPALLLAILSLLSYRFIKKLKK